MRQLRQEIIARWGEQGDFEEQQEKCRRHIDLTAGRESSAGVWDYRLRTDNEGRAILEAAIGTLAAPRPNPDGTLDARPVGRRRGEALTEALRRSVIATSGDCPSTSPKAVLMLTMGYDDLRAQVGAAYAAGTLATGIPIAPDTVRKLACDAAIVSVVVGNSGEILNQGREKRLFTWAQLKNLWARDHHCTFPGCTAPAAWTDAHHLVHWADGGRTDLSNAALLCGRHHTIVHRDRLAGTVTPDGVVWDLRPGSYRPPDPAEEAQPRPACQAPARTRPGRQADSGHARSPAEKQSGARRSRSANRRAEPGDVRAGRKPTSTGLGHPPANTDAPTTSPARISPGSADPAWHKAGITHRPDLKISPGSADPNMAEAGEPTARPKDLTGIRRPHMAHSGIQTTSRNLKSRNPSPEHLGAGVAGLLRVELGRRQRSVLDGGDEPVAAVFGPGHHRRPASAG